MLGRALLERVRAAAGNACLPAKPEDICVAYVANKFLMQLQYYRSLRPGGWRARLALEGREHLDGALQLNQGVILWVTPTTSSDLVVRRCLAENGYAISHLSALTHGYSESRFGLRCINAPNRAVEDRYMRARIVLDRGTPGPALAEIEERLAANEIVSITVTPNKGRKSLEVSLLSAQLPLGAGALNFSYRTGAPLLPVFCVCEADGSYSIHIHPPLVIDREKVRNEATGEALVALGRQVENFALRYPDQWYGWAHLRTDELAKSRTRGVWDWIHKMPKDQSNISITQ
jgi:lauroyl/myristoyl acyltransferase